MGGLFDQCAVEPRDFGLDPVAGIDPAAFVARIGRRAHRRQQRLDRAHGGAFGQSPEPEAGRERVGRLARRLDRLSAAFVVAGDIGEPRGKPPAPPLRSAFGAEDPALQFHRLAAR